MKLFSKEVNLKLFKQYPKGGDLQNQVVVTKIFNPYGAGRWYLINSDPDDPDYIWAIVQMGSTVEVGSVSRNQLESIRIKPFNLPLERDLYFDPVNAAELFKGLSEGKFYKAGGWTEGSENKAMLLNQAEGFEHHAEELEKAVKASDHIPAWVVAKSERASTDLSDITHYLDGENEQKREMVEGEEEEEYADGGEVKWQEAEYGDNALVVSENKMGVIIKPYGRKFHLKFVDGTEKTYDASELKFFKDMDDFDRGGKMAYGGIMNVGRYYKDKKGETFRFVGNETFINKNGEYVRKSITEFYEVGGETKEARFIIKSGNKGKLNEVLNQPSWQLQPFQLREVFDNEKMNGKSVFLFVNDELYEQYVQESDEDYYGEGGYMAEGGATEKKYFMTVYFEQKQSSGGYGINRKSITVRAKNETEAKAKAKKLVKESFRSGLPIKNMRVLEDTIKVEEINYAEGGMMDKGGKIYKIQVKDSHDIKPKWEDDTWHTGGKKYLSFKDAQIAVKKLQGDTAYAHKQFKVVEDKEKMAMGGKVKFADKVASVKASLLKRKKVPKAVQKDYGKTFSPAEAEDSAKRIVGAMTAKERLQARLKKRKK